MAKLALLFSGQVRNINPYLFNASLRIFIGQHDADIYMCHWDTSGKSGNHDPSILLKDTCTHFDIKVYLKIAFRDITVRKHRVMSDADWSASCNEQVREIIENRKYNILTINSAKQIFQIHTSYLLIDDTAKYDFIVRCRFDSVFLFEFQAPKCQRQDVVSNINFGNAFYENRVYDIFFFTTHSCSSAVFSSPWLEFSELVTDDFHNGLDKRDACRILYLNAIKRNLDVVSTSFRYCDIYRNKSTYFWDVFRWGLSNEKSRSKTLKKYMSNVLIMLLEQKRGSINIG